MKITVIIAGNNSPSNCEFLAERFIEGMEQVPETTVEVIKLKELTLEHFALKHYDSSTDQGADFEKLKRTVEGCDGMLIASPIWNFSVPGHLKNAIDRMGSFALDAESRSLGMLKGKPVFLLFTGGTPLIAWTGLQRRTVSHMPVSLRYFGCVIIGKHYEERCTPGRGKFDCVVDKRPASQEIIRNKGRNFAKVVVYKVKTGRLPPLQALLLWVFKTGQKAKKKLGI